MLNKLLEYLRKKRKYKKYIITFEKTIHPIMSEPIDFVMGRYHVATDYFIMDTIYNIQLTSKVWDNKSVDDDSFAFYILGSDINDRKCKVVIECIPEYVSKTHHLILKNLQNSIENVSITKGGLFSKC